MAWPELFRTPGIGRALREGRSRMMGKSWFVAGAAILLESTSMPAMSNKLWRERLRKLSQRTNMANEADKCTRNTNLPKCDHESRLNRTMDRRISPSRRRHQKHRDFRVEGLRQDRVRHPLLGQADIATQPIPRKPFFIQLMARITIIPKHRSRYIVRSA